MNSLPLVHLAYLDGGSGSMIFQIVIASVLSLGYIVKTQWANLRAIVQVNRKDRTQE